MSCRIVLNPSLIMALVVGVSPILVAQSSTTGALSGTVRDAAGNPIAEAKVRITSSALIGERVAVTTKAGSYQISALPPGKYSVVITAPGFVTGKSPIAVELGQVVNQHFRLAAESLQGAIVEVVADGSKVDPAPSIGRNITYEALENISANRSLNELINITPGINNGVAWGGAQGNVNAYLVDGVNMSDPSAGGSFGYTNPDWFSEIQVGGIGAGAEYGGFTGGYINAVTKRGGNTVEGTADAYFSSSSWSSKTTYSHPNFNPPPSPKTEDKDLSVSIGGPIIKDKLWYFFSGEQLISQEATPGAVVPVELKNPRLMGKLTYQVLPSATLEAFFSWTGVYRTNRGIGLNYPPETCVSQNSGSPTFGLTWTQTFGGATVLTSRLSGFTSYDTRKPNGGDRPSVAVSAASDGSMVPGSLSGLTQWPANFTHFNNAVLGATNVKSRITASSILDHFRSSLLLSGDSHAFRGGFEWEQASDEQNEHVTGGRSYSAKYIAPVLNPDGSVRTPARISPTSALVGKELALNARIDRLMLFVQDTWTLSDRLTLRPGLRFEQFKGRAYGDKSPVWTTSTFAPRFGGTVALTADNRNVLKLHVGRYFDGLSMAYFDRATTGGGYTPRTQYVWGNAATDNVDVHNPEAIPLGAAGPTTTSYSSLQPGIKHPYQDEATASYERAFGQNWTVGLTGIYRNDYDMIARVLTNPAAMATGTWLYTIDPFTKLPVGAVYPDPATATWAIKNVDDAKRTYRSATLSAERRMANSWALSASYTRAQLRGNMTKAWGYNAPFETPSSLYNAEGLLPGFHEHEVKIRPVYKLGRFTFSGIFTYLSGERTTRTLTFNSSNIPALWYAPRGTDKYPSQKNLDLKVAAAVYQKKQTRVEAYVDVFNALNSSAPTAWDDTINTYYNVDTFNANFHKADIIQNPRSIRIGIRLRY
ncbi:MAG: TonB-dependent receptor [Holophagaceae bacterium]|uniref:TonB-dependent receptor n=1 Tax=Candidatus Geothrix skivensis TaxID=2954439 RepID=A0A9D7SGH1_9BACT|nr:TonB-dependent receptor [Candidatus Geothrix skivensis]